MKKNWLIIAVVVLVLVLIGLVVKTKFLGHESPAALQISATPKSIIFIDGAQVGTTGEMGYVNDKLKPGEHKIKLVPESSDSNLIPWEGKVNLTSGIMVVINRVLGSKQSESSGQILTLEKIGRRDKSSLAVVSVPDQAVVKVNGETKGFAPIVMDNLAPGDYQVAVSSSGYQPKTISAKTIAGYKLVVNVQLARQVEGIEEATGSAEPGTVEPTSKPEANPTAEAKASPAPELEKPYVKIKSTPTGWLRVRKGPSTSQTELAKVKPGESYPYLNEKQSGWYKIEYEKGKEGWISSVYAELVK